VPIVSADPLESVKKDSSSFENDSNTKISGHSSQTDNSTAQLQKMVVTSGRRQRILESNRSVILIGPEEWLGTNKSVADVIAEHTGIQTRKYGGMGSFQTVSIRGIKGSEILVLLDGVPLNSSMGGPVDLGVINPVHLQEIEVYKGVTSSILGGSSLGGVINLKTKPLTKGSSFDLQTEIGSFSKQRIASGISKTINTDVSIYGGASFGRCENNISYLDRNNTLRGSSDWGLNDPRIDDTIRTLKNGQFRSVDFTFHPTIKMTKFKKRVVGNVYYGDIVSHKSAPESKDNETARYIEKKVVASIALQNEDSTKFEITPRLGYVFTDGVTKWDEKRDQSFSSSHGGATLGPASSGMGEHSLDGKLELKYCPYDNIKLQGLLFCEAGDAHPKYNRGINAHGDWHSRRALGGAAVDLTAKIKRFTFSTGGSLSGIYDETEGGIDGVSNHPVEPADTIIILWNGEVGISFRPFENTHIFLNGGHSTNQPSLRERFGANGAVMANPELKAEAVNAAEAGVKVNYRWIFLECATFFNRTENTVEFISDGYLIRPVNNEGSRIYGLELSSIIDITKYASVDLAATWQHAENLDITYMRKKRMMPDEPKLSIVSGVNFKPLTCLTFSYKFRYKSVYWHDLANTDLFRVPGIVNANSTEDGVFLHDFLLVWKINQNLDLRASIDNAKFGKNGSMENSIERGYQTVITPASWWNFTVAYCF
jgi:outer membrane receptor protein involved in Fe transport